MSLEHRQLIWFADAVLWMDRLLKCSVRRAVPRLDQLLAEPAETLHSQPVVIGPARNYVRGLLLGALFGCVATFAAFATYLDVVDPFGNRRPLQPRPARIVALFVTVLIFTATTALVLRLLRGGTMVLSPSGVEIHYRKDTVKCPWEFFDVDLQAVTVGKTQFLLHVADEQLGLVHVFKRGRLLPAGAAVKTRQVRTKPSSPGRTCLVFSDLYRVKLLDLVKLLVFLGNSLGSDSRGAVRPSADSARTG